MLVHIQTLGDVQPNRRASTTRARVVLSQPSAASALSDDLDTQPLFLPRQFAAYR